MTIGILSMSFYTAKTNVFFEKQIVARKVNKQQNEVVIAATTDPHKGVNTSKKRPDGNISSVKVREKSGSSGIHLNFHQ